MEEEDSWEEDLEELDESGVRASDEDNSDSEEVELEEDVNSDDSNNLDMKDNEGPSDLEDDEEPDESHMTGKSQESDIETGKAVRDQLRIWDTLLCLRIRFQKLLVEANKLPSPQLFDLLKSDHENGSPNPLSPAVDKCSNSLNLLTDSLLDLQELLIVKNPETNKITEKASDPAADSGDEEITSSEDEGEDEMNSSWKSAADDDEDGEEDENDDDEGDGFIEEADSSQVEKMSAISGEKKKRRRRKQKKRNRDYKEEITKRFQSLIPFRNEVIEKWNSKTEIASGKYKNKNSSYSSFHVSALKQINQVLSDKERLIRRTQLKRSQYSIIGETGKDNEGESENKKKKNEDHEENGEKDSEQNNYSEEIFDDDDFYHQLLREVIERKTSSVHDPTELSSRWLELQKIRGKTKRKVDTKSSKGRKVRYAVFSKLVNFMAPFDECPMTDNAYNQLVNSLFDSGLN